MLLLCALLLGVVAGLRSMLAPTIVSWFARNGVLAVANTPRVHGFSARGAINRRYAVGPRDGNANGLFVSTASSASNALILQCVP